MRALTPFLQRVLSSRGAPVRLSADNNATNTAGFSVSTTADIVWALQQQRHRQQAAEKAEPPFFGSSRTRTAEGSGRRVELAALRGFPKSDKPWMPRLKVEPSPTGSTNLTPPSSAVESPGSDETDVPSPQLSAPGRKTFSGIGASGNSTLGFAGARGARSAGGGGGATAKIYPADEQPLLSAATVESGYGALPPSPETAVSTPARIQRPFSSANRNMSSSETPVADAAAERKRSYISTRASTVEIGNNNSGSSSMPVLAVAPRSPEEEEEEATKNEEDSGDGGDSNGSADSNGGGRARGPAPTQANANAGGDPAIPFGVFRGGGRATSAASQPAEQEEEEEEEEQQQGQGQGQRQGPPGGHGRSSFLGLEVGNALAACWGDQVYDNDGSRPVEFNLENAVEVDDTPVLRPPPVLLAVSRSNSATSSSVAGGSLRDDASTGSVRIGNDFGFGDGDNDDLQDARSVTSSTQSSLLLTAVSPSRVPPPLVSVASTLPLPPVSMASSVVSGSFSNPWHSPTAADPDAVADARDAPDDDLDSLSWLKPLPTPPPRGKAVDDAPNTSNAAQGQQQQQQQQRTASSAAGMMSGSTTPPSNRAARSGVAYPSGRWVQTPQRGEILRPTQAEPKFSGSRPGSDEDTGSLD